MSLSQTLLPGVPLVESPLLERSMSELGLTDAEQAIALQLHRLGYALIDFPDAKIGERIERIKRNLGPKFGIEFHDPSAIKNDRPDLRIQDAWTFDEDVAQIAANREILNLLSKLYGRRAFPFQTLNFPVGTQQALHSDSIHFSSIPERFMCGVWLAFEDVALEAGPLVYLPGSHKWPILSNAMIGRSGAQQRIGLAQSPFEAAWEALVDSSGLQRERFLPVKGQALIWAANLLHGGDVQHDPTLTRWSQVTHYYFENCTYYTPAFPTNRSASSTFARSPTSPPERSNRTSGWARTSAWRETAVRKSIDVPGAWIASTARTASIACRQTSMRQFIISSIRTLRRARMMLPSIICDTVAPKAAAIACARGSSPSILASMV